jgi:tetratricopeptide (TPR) repeat protein
MQSVSLSRRILLSVCLSTAFIFAPHAAGGQSPDKDKDFDREFKSAVAEYNAGHLPQAAAELETMLREVPESFEVHELLGLVYAEESKDSLANEHLEKAVRLNQGSAAARTNLATNLIRIGKLESAEQQLQKALAIEPENYDANHDLGELYVRMEKLPQALPFLAQAQQANPSSYENGYDLALAYLLTGGIPKARETVTALLKINNTAELHNLLGQVEEKDGQFVAAANEFERAAHQDPSESNLFDWASELLLHRTLEPAIEVFRQSAERFPNSTRIAIGLGIAYYSRGNYDDAVKSLLRAADLSPSDPRCYLFLSKAYDSSPSQAGEVIQHFRRFAELAPNNARAQYYYAMSLWKGRRAEDPGLDLNQVEDLLRKSIALDPAIADSHLQLGNFYSDQKKYKESIPEYLRAKELNPALADAYYRLGQAYVRTGQKDLAQEQFKVYQGLRERQVADLDKARGDIRQFIYSEQNGPAAKP